MRIKSLKRVEKIISTLAGTLVLFILFLPSASGAVEWTIERIDSEGDVGWDTSIAICPAGNVHISYIGWAGWGLGSQLKYVTNATGVWVTEVIDSIGLWGGGHTSIAIDLNGNAHISYSHGYHWHGGPNYKLKYATNVTGVWVIETIDSVEWGGGHTSIAIDSSGNVHISYVAGLNYQDLKYATNATGVWVTSTIDSGWVERSTSIAMDSLNNVHISYSGDGDLKYATNVTGVWKTSTIDGEGFWILGFGFRSFGFVSDFDIRI